jgi:hypothetical protein
MLKLKPMAFSQRIEQTNTQAPVPMSIIRRDGLIRTQKRAMLTRALRNFGPPALLDGGLLDPPSEEQQQADFSCSFLVGGVYALTLKYFNGYQVPEAEEKEHDISQNMSRGGHAQQHQLVTAAVVTRRISLNQVEVFMDTLVVLGYGSGPRTATNRYILHKDGCMRYWESKNTHANAMAEIDYDNDTVSEWSNPEMRPRWEFTRFPVLPVVVHGV